jgi:hypothetical protein
MAEGEELGSNILRVSQRSLAPQGALALRAQMNRVLAQPCLLARQGLYAVPIRIPTSTAGIAGAPQRFILDPPAMPGGGMGGMGGMDY